MIAMGGVGVWIRDGLGGGVRWLGGCRKGFLKSLFKRRARAPSCRTDRIADICWSRRPGSRPSVSPCSLHQEHGALDPPVQDAQLCRELVGLSYHGHQRPRRPQSPPLQPKALDPERKHMRIYYAHSCKRQKDKAETIIMWKNIKLNCR